MKFFRHITKPESNPCRIFKSRTRLITPENQYWLTFPDSVSEMLPLPYPFLRSLLPEGIKHGLADHVANGVVEPWTFLFLLKIRHKREFHGNTGHVAEYLPKFSTGLSIPTFPG